MSQIIVGMDESEHAAAALRWAMREGLARAWPVTAILAYSYLDQHNLGAEHFEPDYDHDAAAAILDQVVVRAVGEDAAVDIHRQAVCALPVDTLVEASTHADLLAVGARGHGGFSELLVGSVSSRCLQRAVCPVVVVREAAGRPGQHLDHIVVGVDGSDSSGGALRWALDSARVHEATVEVVHAWQPPAFTGTYRGTSVDPTLFLDAGQAALDRIVDAADTAGVTVKRSLVCDGAARALLEAATDADLVVVGSRGLGRVKSLLLGSVSHQVVEHAPCPVVVVPTDRCASHETRHDAHCPACGGEDMDVAVTPSGECYDRCVDCGRLWKVQGRDRRLIVETERRR